MKHIYHEQALDVAHTLSKVTMYHGKELHRLMETLEAERDRAVDEEQRLYLARTCARLAGMIGRIAGALDDLMLDEEALRSLGRNKHE